GAGIREVRDLDGRGFDGEQRHAKAAARMKGQINEDVDAVGADLPREVGVAKQSSGAPLIDCASHAIGHLVGKQVVAVTSDVKLGAVVVLEEGENESAD